MEPVFDFKGRDIINGYDFTNQELCHIMDTAMIYEKRVKSGEAIKDLEGMLVATLFFEPSTRTRLSFNSAIQRVGASTIDLGNASVSSQAKGETWQDTLRTVDGYVDAIVMRHPVAGSAIEAADIAVHP
ncbi:MAG: aspartate carbamoyltransferase, partial [Lachnospiraceae bacterium]|nr:aspartate carbamoyltransferase [Lachnospiraceae bacterium]